MGEAMAWMRDGLCREPDYVGLPWFPSRGHTPAALKAICGRCAVREECLEYAVSQGIEHGIWGGLSPRERHAATSDVPTMLNQPTPPTTRLAG
jgi:WhiB family transcriptional regulator, redox-sensing transcriptional regulator